MPHASPRTFQSKRRKNGASDAKKTDRFDEDLHFDHRLVKQGTASLPTLLNFFFSSSLFLFLSTKNAMSYTLTALKYLVKESPVISTDFTRTNDERECKPMEETTGEEEGEGERKGEQQDCEGH